MIYTCTLNPSIDYVVKVEQFQEGFLNRSKDASYFPGGKGINVSRVLNNLGINNTALGFIGGFTGDYVKTCLTKEGIAHDFVEHDEPTRINVKLKTTEETEINGAGPSISKELQQALYHKVSSLTSDDYFVLAGSAPASLSSTFFDSLLEICQEKKIPTIVDVSGPTLQRSLLFEPFLIKPNHHELGDLVGKKIETKVEALQSGRELLEQGAKNVIVSMGGEGAVFLNKEYEATVEAPKGNVINTVGAGDSTVAGFLASYVKTQEVLEAFHYGVSAGSATAFLPDLCKKENVENLYPQITIKRVK